MNSEYESQYLMLLVWVLLCLKACFFWWLFRIDASVVDSPGWLRVIYNSRYCWLDVVWLCWFGFDFIKTCWVCFLAVCIGYFLLDLDQERLVFSAHCILMVCIFSWILLDRLGDTWFQLSFLHAGKALAAFWSDMVYCGLLICCWLGLSWFVRGEVVAHSCALKKHVVGHMLGTF